MFRQISGTAMGTKFAPPYACLTMGYLEETILFPITFKKYFDNQSCDYMKRNYLRYMDDGFIVLPNNIDSEIVKNALNELHPTIKFTMEEGRSISEHEESLNFLDIEIILTKERKFIPTFTTKIPIHMITLTFIVLTQIISKTPYPLIWQIE